MRRPAIIRPFFRVAGILQALIILMVGIENTVIAEAFCEGPGLCTIRGARWLIWIALAFLYVVILAPSVVFLTAGVGRPATLLRRFITLEIAVLLTVLPVGVLELTSELKAIDPLLALVASLGVLILVGHVHQRHQSEFPSGGSCHGATATP